MNGNNISPLMVKRVIELFNYPKSEHWHGLIVSKPLFEAISYMRRVDALNQIHKEDALSVIMGFEEMKKALGVLAMLELLSNGFDWDSVKDEWGRPTKGEKQ